MLQHSSPGPDAGRSAVRHRAFSSGDSHAGTGNIGHSHNRRQQHGSGAARLSRDGQMNSKTNLVQIITLERALAMAAVVICLFLDVRVWQVFSPQQPMWPLPAYYLFETAALSLVALSGIFRGDELGNVAAWAVVGALLGFAIIGGFSIGFFYLPVAAFLGLAALRQDRHAWRRLLLHLGIALLVGVAQAALMLGLIQPLYPSAAS